MVGICLQNAMTSFCYAMMSFYCDLILDVHYDIITSENDVHLKMTKPAVVFDATFFWNITCTILHFKMQTKRGKYVSSKNTLLKWWIPFQTFIKVFQFSHKSTAVYFISFNWYPVPNQSGGSFAPYRKFRQSALWLRNKKISSFALACRSMWRANFWT